MKAIRWFLLASLWAFALPMGCTPSGGDGASGADDASSSAAAGDGAAAGSSDSETSPTKAPAGPPGTLAFTVTYTGEAPAAPEALEVAIDPEHCGGKVFPHGLAVGAGGGLGSAVLRLEGVRGSKPPIEQITVVNRDCGFHPHVAVAHKGTKIKIENEDPILHTTHPYIDGKDFFNVPLKKGDTYPARRITSSGIMKIKCDVHPWMEAWVVVHDTPYVAKTGTDGKGEIGEVPPGTYSWVLWHESLGEQRGEVEIVAGETATVTLEYAAKE